VKLITDFNDYYDGTLKSDGDFKTVFVRKQELIEIPLPPNNPLPKMFRGEVLFIAGQWFPYYVWFDPRNWDGRPNDTIHRIPTHITFDREIAIKHGQRDYVSPIGYSIPMFFDMFREPPKELTELEKHGPIFKLIATYDRRYAPRMRYGFMVERNPNLQSIGFHKMIPPGEIYNMLYRWFCNHSREPMVPEMDNETKIALAGFDTKTSFRQPKQSN
jgi:hypothetical protein